jgi:hypothetical protein
VRHHQRGVGLGGPSVPAYGASGVALLFADDARVDHGEAEPRVQLDSLAVERLGVERIELAILVHLPELVVAKRTVRVGGNERPRASDGFFESDRVRFVEHKLQLLEDFEIRRVADPQAAEGPQDCVRVIDFLGVCIDY